MKPDFIGIGAFRSGTSSLAIALRQHPEIDVWKYKECYYWNKRYNKQSFSWYQSQFHQGKISGEITPSYFVQTDVIDRIKKHLPNAKFLLLLRDPVQATISAYWMRHNWRKVRISLETLAKQMANGDRPSWVHRYDYPMLLTQWLGVFDREQFWIARSEDVWSNPQLHLNSLWQFLDVSQIDTTEYPHRAHIQRKEKASEKTIKILESVFRPLNESLPDMIGQEFIW